jgi:O-antigen/teichoic acid export membrane protein
MGPVAAQQAQEAPQLIVEGQRRGIRQLGEGTTIMVVLSTLANVCNYASNLVFGHMLSTEAYGDLTALLALVTLVAVPTGAAQTVIAERIAVLMASGNGERVRYLIRYAWGHAFTLAVIVGVIYTACIPLVKSALGLQAVGPALALAPLIVLAILIPVFYGVLQGMERFAVLGLLTLVVAASRLVFGVPWTLAGGGAGGPLFGQALGTVVAVAAAVALLRTYMLRRGTGAAAAGMRRIPDVRTLAAAGAFVGFALLSNLDVLLAKLFLPSHGAGEYAALVTIEKAIIFLPSAVAIVLVPAAAKARATNHSSARVLRLAALVVGATILISAVPPLIAPHLVLTVMFGAKYQAAAAGVRPIVIAGAALSLLYLLVVYTVAIQDKRWVYLLVGGVLLQISAISAFHQSPTEVAVAQATVITTVLVVNELLFHPLLRGERWLVRGLRQ